MENHRKGKGEIKMIVLRVQDFLLPDMFDEDVDTIVDVINWKAYQFEWEVRNTNKHNKYLEQVV
jgi:hypothetical protein